MNATYIHLLVNHLPLFGALFGTAALVWGLLKKNSGLKTAGLLFLLVASLGGWVAHISGEKAEHFVEELPGVSRQSVHEHEEAPKRPISLSSLWVYWLFWPSTWIRKALAGPP